MRDESTPGSMFSLFGLIKDCQFFWSTVATSLFPIIAGL
jgi:hypothetical protein